jgi:sugar/nucleoside kinase (ribokinase family)
MNLQHPRACFLGLCTIDVIHSVAQLPARNSKSVAAHQQVFAGGPATNAAATFSHLGGHAWLLTVVGNNPVVSIIHQDLDRFGIEIVDLDPSFTGLPSLSSILVTESNGDRVVVSANATRLPAPRLIDPVLLENCSVLLVDGHFMRASIEAAHYANAKGIPVILDSGSWKSGMEELLPCIDVAICSQDFVPSAGYSEDELVNYFFGQGIEDVAITAGEQPIRYYRAEEGERGSIPVGKVKAVDTLGAGDVFHGAFCYRYAADPSDFTGSLAFAASVATRSCQSFGTRAWMQDDPKR